MGVSWSGHLARLACADIRFHPPDMTQPFRRHRPLLRAAALGCAVLWGLVEFLALCRTRLPAGVFRHD